MKRNVLSVIVLAAVQLTAASAFAQTIKPGLWQINNKSSSANAETNKAMAQMAQQIKDMTPEQRKMMEEMTSKHGIAMPTFGNDGGIAISTCITPEMAARKQIPVSQQGDCKTNNELIAGGIKMAFTCTNPPSSGEGKLSYIGDTAFTMAMDITTTVRGAPERMRIDSTGKWISAACPVAPAGAK